MSTLYEQAEQEFACSHPETEIRYKVLSNGTIAYHDQCLVCGEAVSPAIKHSNVPNRGSVLPFNEALRESRRERIHARWEQLSTERETAHKERRTEWWQEYNAYLASDGWQDKRQRVLERDGYTCQACLKRRASQVHHLTYNHVFNEPLFELVAVCDVCHEELTRTDADGKRDAEVSPVLSR